MNQIYSRLIFLISFLTAMLLQTTYIYAQVVTEELVNETFSAGTLSPNLTAYRPDNKTSNWEVINGQTGFEGKVVGIYKKTGNTQTIDEGDFLITNELKLHATANSAYTVSFDRQIDGKTDLKLVLMSSDNRVVKEKDLSEEQKNKTHESYSFKVDESGKYKIGFRVKNLKGKVYLYIDNFRLTGTFEVKKFYNKATTDLKNLSNWGTNDDGSGTLPTSFEHAYQEFRIVNYSAKDIIKLQGKYTVSGKGSKTVLGNGTTPVTLETSNSNGNSKVSIGVMDLTNNATLIVNAASAPTLGTVAPNSTVILGKNAPNILDLNSNFGNLTVEKPGKLAKNIKVTGKIEFKDGKVDVGDHTLELTNTTEILNASRDKHIMISGAGRVRKALSAQQRLGSVTIPVGSAAGYSPVTISGNTSEATFEVGVQDNDLSAAQVKTADNKTVKPIMGRTWNVSASAGTSATITLTWVATTDADKLLVTGDEVQLMQYTGNAWKILEENAMVSKSGELLSVTYTYNPAAVTPQSGLRASATQQAVAAPLGTNETSPREGDVTVGSSPTVLPVDLIRFSAVATANHAIALHWATAQERNNAYFAIERSHDGKNFTAIGRRQGKGTTTTRTEYSFTDNSPLSGISYYRLRQVDTDGTFKLLPMVAISLQETHKVTLRLYPNPSTGGNVQLQVKGLPADEAATIVIADVTGKKLYRQSLPANGALLLPTQNLKAGMYLVTVRCKTQVLTQKLLIK